MNWHLLRRLWMGFVQKQIFGSPHSMWVSPMLGITSKVMGVTASTHCLIVRSQFCGLGFGALIIHHLGLPVATCMTGNPPLYIRCGVVPVLRLLRIRLGLLRRFFDEL